MIQWSHGITVHKCVVLFYFGGVRNGLQLDRSEYRLAVDVCDVVSHMAYRELCIILQVCICLVSERLCQTELMDAQLTVMIVLSTMSICYHICRQCWGLVRIVYWFFVVCCDPCLSDSENWVRAFVRRGK